MTRVLAIYIALGGCVATGTAPPVTDRGCSTYSIQRVSMPPLGEDDLSWWVAETDTALTVACRP